MWTPCQKIHDLTATGNPEVKLRFLHYKRWRQDSSKAVSTRHTLPKRSRKLWDNKSQGHHNIASMLSWCHTVLCSKELYCTSESVSTFQSTTNPSRAADASKRPSFDHATCEMLALQTKCTTLGVKVRIWRNFTYRVSSDRALLSVASSESCLLTAPFGVE